MGYLFYRIDIVMIGETSQKMNQNESEGQIFKKGFENYIRQNKKLNKDEMIRKILTDTFHLLKYYYIPALESPYLDYVFDEQQKSQIKDYVNLLEYYWAEFSEHKQFIKSHLDILMLLIISNISYIIHIIQKMFIKIC